MKTPQKRAGLIVAVLVCVAVFLAGYGAATLRASSGGSVPVIVAQAHDITDTMTAENVTVLRYVPQATGIYSASLGFYLGHAGEASVITASLIYFSGTTRAGATQTFVAGITYLGPGTMGPGEHSAGSLTFYALAKQPIAIVYNDQTPTPNDRIIAVLEQLS